MNKKKIIWIVSISLLCIILIFTASLMTHEKAINRSAILKLESQDLLGRQIGRFYYGNYLAENADGSPTAYDGQDIVLHADASNEILESYQGLADVTLSHAEGIARFKATVEVDGYYNIEVDYICKNDSSIIPERQLLIDSEMPFEEAYFLRFERYYIETNHLKMDRRGDQIREAQKEIYEYQTKLLNDSESFYKEPLRFYLTRGVHEIAFIGKESDLVFAEVRLTAPGEILDYEEYISRLSGTKKVEKQLKFESEFPAMKNSSSLRSEWNNDSLSSPAAITNIRYNVFGGASWQNGSDGATWIIEVEEDGLYTFAFRYTVPKTGFISYRKIMIDGEVPFKEFLEYPFTGTKWSLDRLVDKEGNPLSIYLTKGRHKIAMQAVVGPLRKVIYTLDECQKKLDEMYRKISLVTATVKDQSGKAIIDRNRDYDLDVKIPHLMDDIKEVKDLLIYSNNEIMKASQGKKQQIAASMEFAINIFDKMQKMPELIPYQLNEFTNIIVSISNAVASMKQAPLYLDYMLIGDENADLPRFRSNLFDHLSAMGQSLFNSFKNDAESGNEGKKITVWSARGRDWVLLLNQMTSDDFTDRTGIDVQFNIMPMTSDYMIITAKSGGRMPDVALGMGGSTPVEFAARDAIVDLKPMPGFDALVSELVVNSTKGFTYKDGVYALPETADYQVLFYRTDIFDQLELTPPDTFEDIYKMLPILQENGMQFYYPAGPGGFAPFLFQAGQNYYSDDLRKTNIDSVESIKAFEEFTDLFNKRKLPLQADFFQRMRMGEMPVGVGGYDMYVRLLTSAPELSGKWAMAPFPGHLKDGVIDRSAPAGLSAAILLKTANDPMDSWEFLKWYLSSATQIRYGSELANLLGIGSQWNSANVEAVKKLGIKKEYLKVILEQWKFFEQAPIVPGSYYVDRNLLNAWNRNVINGESARIVLEDAAIEINKELERKYQEFNKK